MLETSFDDTHQASRLPLDTVENTAGDYGGFRNWVLIGLGILLAGAGCGLFFCFIFSPFWLFLLSAGMVGSIGGIWTAFVSAMVLPLFYLFARSLRLRASFVWLGAIAGGLVGFVAILPLWLTTTSRGFDSSIVFLLFVALGPGLTTVFGQLGGAWGGQSAQRNRESTIEHHLAKSYHSEPLLRFQIRHLLWITVWLALLLTVIRLSGIQFELILPVLVAWLVYQAATLYCGWQLFTKLLPWWSRRRASCST